MTMIDVFAIRSSESAEDARLEEIKKLAEALAANGVLCVGYRLKAPDNVSYYRAVVDLSVHGLVARLRPFGVEPVAGEPRVIGRESNSNWLDVFVELESDVIHFTEAPWHPDNAPGGETSRRLQEMARRGEPFMVSYVFSGEVEHYSMPNGPIIDLVWKSINEGRGILQGPDIAIVRREWSVRPDGKCRIDIRIEPERAPSTPEVPAWTNLKPEGGRLRLAIVGVGNRMDDAPIGIVESVLRRFQEGATIEAMFMAPKQIRILMCATVDTMAEQFIAEWLAAHGLREEIVDVKKCHEDGTDPDPYVRVEFHRRSAVE